MKEYPIHPACADVPKMTEQEYAEFKEDIRLHGLDEAVVILDGKVIDGRHRQRACVELDIKFDTIKYVGKKDEKSIRRFVKRRVLLRRNLSPSQRAMHAAEYADIGDEYENKNPAEFSGKKTRDSHQSAAVEAAAEAAGVSADSVKKAKKLKAESPKLAEKVASGDMTLNAATNAMNADKKKAEAEESAKPVRDALDNEVPEKLRDVFTTTVFADILSGLRAQKKAIKAILDTELGAHIHPQQVMKDLDEVIRAIKFAEPYEVCPYCRNASRRCAGDKAVCKRSGWIPKEVSENVPRD